MGRLLTISVLLGSLLAVPALCMGGVITHACECESDFPCTCETDCDHETGCGHEGGCPEDPCSIRVIRPERQDDLVVTVSQLAVSTAILCTPLEQPSIQTVRADTSELPGTKKLPFPPSDLPLLI